VTITASRPVTPITPPAIRGQAALAAPSSQAARRGGDESRSLRLFQGGAQRGDVVMGGIHGDYFTPKT